MMRKIALSAVSALVLSSGVALAAGGPESDMIDKAFVFEGPMGKFDQAQLQRGLQVFSEVCSACHGMRYVPIRTLADPGGPQLPPEQVREYAAGLDSVVLPDGSERTREWTDPFPIRAGDGMGPDLSLMAKARAGFHGPYGSGINQLTKGMGGPEYIYSYLTHFAEANPDCAPDGIDGYYYNTVFAVGGIPDSCKDEHGVSTIKGSYVQMPPALFDDLVTYEDGTAATMDQMAEDVAAFLMWAAEPKMMARKQAGFIAVGFLFVLTVLLYFTNKQIWAAAKNKKKHA